MVSGRRGRDRGADREAEAGQPAGTKRGHVGQGQHHRDLDERSNDGREGLSRTEPDDGHSHGDGQLEVVRGRREGQAGRLGVTHAQTATHEEQGQEHDHEVDGQRNGDADDVQRQTDERAARYERYLKTRMKVANFPFHKTLDDFDLSFQPSIDERQIRELADLAFVERGETVVFLGPPGVGKSHLGVALGIEAAASTGSPRNRPHSPRPLAGAMAWSWSAGCGDRQGHRSTPGGGRRHF